MNQASGQSELPRAARVRSRVLILTTFDQDEHVYAALRAGASGFLLKDAGRERLVEEVRQKLRLPERIQAVVLAYGCGLVGPRAGGRV